MIDNRIVTIEPGDGLMGNLAGNRYPKFAQTAVNSSRPAVGGTIAPGETVMLVQFLRLHDGGILGQVRVTYTHTDGSEHLWSGRSTIASVEGCRGKIDWPDD